MRNSDAISLVAAFILGVGAAFASPDSGDPGDLAATDAPRRVVSMNLCTDQLAMMLAAKGQLLSVSSLALDPRSSAMVEEAKAYTPNQGLAEEIYLMHPDLVLAGSFTAVATVDMLTRLGIPVVRFDPEYSLADVADHIIRMGEVLGREDQAAQMVTEFRAGLAAFQQGVSRRPRAALYSANGYTSGDRTLAGQILLAAGFANVATEAGFSDAGFMPLEVLAMEMPEAVITSHPYPGASRSEEIMDHPVVQAVRRSGTSGSFSNADWVCGTPFVLRAIGAMVDLRRRMGAR
ncbi:MAG: ABC transporter substrate-binding protein [Pseudorhodobacter sp.]|nr:ABC transporter substrate-binding protein [Pseudorhodobacter sp.]